MCGWRKSSRLKLTLLRVRSQELGIRTERNAVIAVTGLRKASPATRDEIRVVVVEMSQAMIMAIQHDAVVGLDDRNQWCEVRLIG